MTEALAILAAGATLVCLGALVYLHTLPTGYRPLTDAVSDYGVGPHRVWYRVQASALGIAGILLAGALWSGVDPVPVRPIGLLFVFGLARLAIPSYPTDLDRTKPTPTGRIHIRLAAVAFVTIAFAAPTLHGAVRHDPSWAGVVQLLGWLGWAVASTALATGIALRVPALQHRFGLIERLLYAAMIAWFLVVSIHLA